MVDQTYDDLLKKKVYSVIKQFILDENLPDDTTFFIKLEKRITSTQAFQVFKGVVIIE
jgi:hypothetical protein